MNPHRTPADGSELTRSLRWVWLLVPLALAATSAATACSSDDAPGNDCGGRAKPIAAGMSKVTEQGYTFKLSKLEPSVPVQSDSTPGNHWTVLVTDPDGAKVTGATLSITTYMPDHGHSGPPAAAVETSDGTYDVADLVFPMPTLYAVSLILTLASGEKQTVTLSLCLDVASG